MINKPKKKKTILVVEDERPLVEAIETRLEKKGFMVITARTIEQAFYYLKEIKSIDLIWLDHYLPGEKTGLDLVAKLKSSESKWKKLPIFIVSNTASSGNVRSYMRLGVTKYCVKADYRLDGIIKDILTFLKNPKK